MILNPRFEVALPVGLPPAVFIPLYAEQLRTKLKSLFPSSGYQIETQKISNEKYAVVVLRGALSGMKAEIEMKFSLASQSTQVTVSTKATSKTQRVLERIFAVLLLVLAIPVFFFMAMRARLILALIGTFVVLIPFMIASGVVIVAISHLLYAIAGNEFDSARRAAILQTLQQTPVPDPLALLRSAATQAAIAPPPPPSRM
jgi:hypothetical protein